MGRTNQEGTCLWCGKRLVHACRTEWENTDKRVAACCPYCEVKPVKGEPDDPEDFDEDYHIPGWKCPQCGRPVGDRKVRKVKSRRRFWDKPGYAGSGYFCTLRCGHDFAVAAARNGYRFKPEEE